MSKNRIKRAYVLLFQFYATNQTQSINAHSSQGEMAPQ